MYSKQRSDKDLAAFTDVKVSIDKGTLRLQFSTRISQQFYGKRQAYKALGGRKDTSENREWSEGIAKRIQEDINYQNGANFDPTLAKYLDIKPLATVHQHPSAKPLPKLGELWKEFGEWKLGIGKIEETTYKNHYLCNYTNMLKPYLDESLDNETASEIIKDFLAKQKNKQSVKRLFGILSEMCQRAINKKLLTKDYFAEIKENYKIPKKSKQLSEVEDYRAYTVEERDLIIEHIRNHQRTAINQMADLVEFLFLTGCRHGEAFALKWEYIKFDTGWIIFKESYDTKTKITKGTKTDVNRMFRTKGMNRLINLLKRLYGDGKDPGDLVFKTKAGKQINNCNLQCSWQYTKALNNGKQYCYNGAVTELTEQGKLQYLKPYSTRHTFISIQANNGADLGLLADSCGNSVSVIMKHYLQPDRERILLDV